LDLLNQGDKRSWQTIKEEVGLAHHAHIIETSGESIRLAQALAGKGVTPLQP